jgi:hypothetical protein
MTHKTNIIFACCFLLGVTLFAQQRPPAMLVGSKKAPQVLKAQFQNGLIYAQVPTSTGGTLKLLANTSGGAYLLESAINNNNLKRVSDLQGNAFIKMNDLLSQAGWPTINREKTLVIRDDEAKLESGIDGELGQAWFANYCWKFDYSSQSLVWNEYELSASASNTVPVLFLEGDDGSRKSNLPLVFATIEGVEMPFIIDTGAKVEPTAEASAAMGTYQEEPVATSFIIEFIFDHWSTIHPDWEVVEKADKNLGNVKMIRVPEVTIAGQTTGPVWFCTRPDVNYLEYMSRFTQIPAMGSLGGNFLQGFQMTIDYPNKLAQFAMPNRS